MINYLEEMKYPSGKIVNAGDFIWWNEGRKVAKVVEVYSQLDALDTLGIDQEGIFLTTALSGVGNAASVYHPAEKFADDGIELLSEEDAQRLTRILKETKKRSQSGVDRCISVDVDLDGRFVVKPIA